MPETVKWNPDSDDVSKFPSLQHGRIGLVCWEMLIALAPALFVLRLYRLAEIPPGIFCGEGTHYANALQVLRSEHTVFFPSRAMVSKD